MVCSESDVRDIHLLTRLTYDLMLIAELVYKFNEKSKLRGRWSPKEQ